MPAAKLTITFAIYFAYYVVANGNVIAVSRLSLPLDGRCDK